MFSFDTIALEVLMTIRRFDHGPRGRLLDRRGALACCMGGFAWACGTALAQRTSTSASTSTSPPGASSTQLDALVKRIVDAARAQVGITLHYDPAYVKLAYPAGDVPMDRGVCTDVIIRALRVAVALDLQQVIHDDIARAPRDYPRVKSDARGSPKRDPSIDHRRVPNQAAYFRRRGWALETSRAEALAAPADIVTWDLGGGLDHIGIVAVHRTWRGRPLVVHNIGRGAQEEDVLTSWRITGWYRVRG